MLFVQSSVEKLFPGNMIEIDMRESAIGGNGRYKEQVRILQSLVSPVEMYIEQGKDYYIIRKGNKENVFT